MYKTFVTSVLLIATSLMAYPEVDKQDGILAFWFGPIDHEGHWSEYYAKRWFTVDPDFDENIRILFEHDIENASLGKYDHWAETAKGRLALILLFDQFPRNIYRGTPRAFSYDREALSLTMEGLHKGQDEELFPIERKFFYMPLMHAEQKEVQEKSLELFRQLMYKAPEEQQAHFERTLRFAKLHYDLVDRFGRFPHRNPILERVCTEDEERYLSESSDRFGQLTSK